MPDSDPTSHISSLKPFTDGQLRVIQRSQLAREVADDLGDALVDGQEPYVARFGPALGVYTGPGAIGIALIQAAA